MISVTRAAAMQIQSAAVDAAAEGMCLRVAAHHDQVSGEVQFGIGFDDAREEDEHVDAHGITLLISPLSRDAVRNLTIDYAEIEPGDFRFIFLHPKDQTDDDTPSGGPPGGCAGCASGCGPKT